MQGPRHRSTADMQVNYRDAASALITGGSGAMGHHGAAPRLTAVIGRYWHQVGSHPLTTSRSVVGPACHLASHIRLDSQWLVRVGPPVAPRSGHSGQWPLPDLIADPPELLLSHVRLRVRQLAFGDSFQRPRNPAIRTCGFRVKYLCPAESAPGALTATRNSASRQWRTFSAPRERWVGRLDRSALAADGEPPAAARRPPARSQAWRVLMCEPANGCKIIPCCQKSGRGMDVCRRTTAAMKR